MTSLALDQRFMHIALRLAHRGLGTTFPNPSVGAVLVKDGCIIGMNHTAPGGRPHAEQRLLDALPLETTEGATLYVSLEPCCHLGKTPPCTNRIIDAKLSRVVVACQDPNPLVAGKGIAMLRMMGMDVTEGVLEKEAKEINVGFFSLISKQRPWISWKCASSIDGRIATQSGHSQWITSAPARQWGHMLRAHYDAIMVGIGTVLADDPLLNCRLPGLEHRSPIRIIADSTLRCPKDAVMLADKSAPVWIMGDQKRIDTIEARLLKGHNAEIIGVSLTPEKKLDLKEAVTLLAEKGITRLLLEGGPRLATGFLQAGLIDEIYWIQGPLLLGGDARAATNLMRLNKVTDAKPWVLKEHIALGTDIMARYQLGEEK